MPRRTLEPLPPTAFHILLALAGGDKHGLRHHARGGRGTENKVRLGPGRAALKVEGGRMADLLRRAKAMKVVRGADV